MAPKKSYYGSESGQMPELEDYGKQDAGGNVGINAPVLMTPEDRAATTAKVDDMVKRMSPKEQAAYYSIRARKRSK